MIRSGVVHAVSTASSEYQPFSTHPSLPVSKPLASNSVGVQVRLDPLSGCSSCSKSGGCGVQMLPVANVPFIVECQRPAGPGADVMVGDRVQVRLPEPSDGWLRIVGYAYGLPTIGMIVGALAGYWTAIAAHMPQLAESFSLAGFIVGLAGGLIAWSRAEKSMQWRFVDENRLQMEPAVIQER